MYIDPHLIWKEGHNTLHKNRPWSTYDDIVVARVKNLEKKIAEKKFIPKGSEDMLDKIVNNPEHPRPAKRRTISERFKLLVRVVLMMIERGKVSGWKASQEELDMLRNMRVDSDEDKDKDNMSIDRHLIWKEGRTTRVLGKALRKQSKDSEKLDLLGGIILKMVESKKLPQEELDMVRNMLGEVKSSKDLDDGEDEDENEVDSDEEEDVNEDYYDEDNSDEDNLDEDYLDEDEDA